MRKLANGEMSHRLSWWTKCHLGSGEHGRESQKSTVAAQVIFGDFHDNHATKRHRGTPVARSLTALFDRRLQPLRCATRAKDG